MMAIGPIQRVLVVVLVWLSSARPTGPASAPAAFATPEAAALAAHWRPSSPRDPVIVVNTPEGSPATDSALRRDLAALGVTARVVHDTSRAVASLRLDSLFAVGVVVFSVHRGGSFARMVDRAKLRGDSGSVYEVLRTTCSHFPCHSASVSLVQHQSAGFVVIRVLGFWVE